MDFDVDRTRLLGGNTGRLEHGGSTVQFRIRVPIFLGILIAACYSTATAQINCSFSPDDAAYYADGSYYRPGGLTTGCFLDPGPCWLGQATFDIMLLSRSGPDSRTIVRTSPRSVDLGPPVGTILVPGDPILNATDLGFSVSAGFRLNLVLAGDDGCDFMFNYLGAHFDNSRTLDAQSNRYSFFEFEGLQPVVDPDPTATQVTEIESSYMSTLTSIELNWRSRQWSRFAPLAGLRFIQLNDRFDRLTGDGSSYLKNSSTDNNLWGLQFGGEGLLWESGRVRLQSTVKAGAFLNDVHLRTGGGDIILETDPVTNAVVRSFDPHRSFTAQHMSFFGEVNLELVYRVCPRVSVRAGYTGMWVDAVALAPDQHDNFNLQSGIGNFDYGTVMYHGGYLGCELTW